MTEIYIIISLVCLLIMIACLVVGFIYMRGAIAELESKNNDFENHVLFVNRYIRDQGDWGTDIDSTQDTIIQNVSHLVERTDALTTALTEHENKYQHKVSVNPKKRTAPEFFPMDLLGDVNTKKESADESSEEKQGSAGLRGADVSRDSDSSGRDIS